MALCKSLNKLDHKEQEKKIGSRPWSKASQRGKLLLVVSFAPLLEIIFVRLLFERLIGPITQKCPFY